MTEQTLTLTQMRYKLLQNQPRPVGGIAQTIYDSEGTPHDGMLSVAVEYDHYDMIRDGKLDILVRPNIAYWQSRLTKRKYKLVKVYNLIRGKVSRVMILEYEGYFTAQSNHVVSMNGSRRINVNAGDFVLKIIKPIKEIKL